MTNFWICKTPTWSQYHSNIEYVSDPSVDLIETFKKQIVMYEDITTHPAYVLCTHVQESAGHVLFIIDGRVEVMLMPQKERKVLQFVSCQDNQ